MYINLYWETNFIPSLININFLINLKIMLKHRKINLNGAIISYYFMNM